MVSNLNNQINYSFIKFRASFHTNFGETMRICGSIEELGNWVPQNSRKMFTRIDEYPEWKIDGEIFAPKGMSFEYKYIYYNDITDEYRWEVLPNDQNRIYSADAPGVNLVLDKEGVIVNHHSKRKKNVKSISDIQFSQTKLNQNLKEKNPKVFMNLDYENNQFSGNDVNEPFNFFLNPKMSSEDRIVIVTAYLPFEVEKHNQGFYTLNINEESLVYSIMYRMKEINFCEVVWVGMLENYFQFEEDDLVEIQNFLEEKNIYLVTPDHKSDYTNFWIYVNNIITPVFVECSLNIHNSSFLDYDEYFESYKAINKLFGCKIANITNPNDLIMINDIHLMLVPSYLLSRNINSKIGIYFHKSFPSSDVMKSFPYHSELIKSVLLCDVIGFHVFQFARNFLTACKRILGIFFEVKYKGFITLSYIGRSIIIRVMHAGIDLDYIKSVVSLYIKSSGQLDISGGQQQEINNALLNKASGMTDNQNFKYGNNEPNKNKGKQMLDQKAGASSLDTLSLAVTQRIKNEFLNSIRKYEALLKNKFSLVSIDNFDESSCLLLKFEAYSKFLDKLVEQGQPVENIVLLQVIKEIPYKTLRTKFIEELDECVLEIKKKHGEGSIIIIKVKNFPIPERFALFKLGSVLYHLQIREGNCMYINEYIAIKHVFKEGLREESVQNSTKSMINPSLIDGQNEYAKRNNRWVLNNEGHLIVNSKFDYGIIISENIGAPNTLKSPIRVNPYNLSAVVNSLICIKQMTSKEKMERFNLDIEFVLNNTTFNWIKNFFIDLKRMSDLDTQKIGIGMGLQFKIMKLKANFCQLNKKTFAEAYHSSKLRVFFLDYEGTLQTAELNGGEETLVGYKPEPSLVKALEKLCSDPNNIVFIVSGRERKKLKEWFNDIDNLNLAAEHGFFVKSKKNYLLRLNQEDIVASESKNNNSSSCLTQPLLEIDRLVTHSSSEVHQVIENKESFTKLAKIDSVNIARAHDEEWEELFKISDWTWKESVLKILEGFTEKTEGSYIYKKDSIITWFYRDCDIYFGMIQANEINTHLHNIFEYCKLDIVNGKGYVEIKPKGVNKGYLVSHVIKALFAKKQIPDFIFAIGDDISDEEMFKYLNSISGHLSYYNSDIKIFSTTIEKKPSSANYFLYDTSEVLEYLEFLSRVNPCDYSYQSKQPKSLSKNLNRKQLSGYSEVNSNLFS